MTFTTHWIVQETIMMLGTRKDYFCFRSFHLPINYFAFYQCCLALFQIWMRV
jgi:hypothetical protein